MWPWEHLAVGYLLHSGVVRALRRRAPTDAGALALAVGTQFPDLVDKPGDWVFGVLPSGTSVAHSVFVAVPVSLSAVELSRRRGAPEAGVAFAVGYLSHLVGDVSYPALLGSEPAYGAVLWPFGPDYPERSVGAFELVAGFFDRYVSHLTSPAGIRYALAELSVLGLAVLAWLWDGKPGAGLARRAVRSVQSDR